MTVYFLIAGSLASVTGFFTNKNDLLAAAKLDDDAIVVTNPNDIHEALTEPQIRRLRADVQARVDGAEDVEMTGQYLFHHDPRFNVKGKKMAQAQKLYNELRAWAGNPVCVDARKTEDGAKATEKVPEAPKAPKAPRAARRNIKQHIRALFPTVGTTRTLAEVAAADPNDPTALYSDVSITTALSDLRSEKYAGEGGVLDVRRRKAEDGTIIFVREA